MKKAALMLALVAFAVSAQAQKNEKDIQVGPEGTDVCQSTFTSGNGASYMAFCTTKNGNVAKYESPSGYDQLYQGGEGYGLCDITNGNVRYYDWGAYGDSGWQDATITQPHGPNTFPLTINRTTADGVWTLKQAFSRNTATPAVKITMTLENNSALTRNVWLERFADVDAGGDPDYNRFDSDLFGAWGVDPNKNGLILRSLGWTFGKVVPAATTDPCNINLLPIPYQGDAATLYQWQFNSMGPKTTKTALMEYRTF